MESHRRSITKTLTWRIFATFVTISVVYAFTRELALSAGIGIADTVVKLFAYYSHERMWDRISFGRKKEKEDYMI
ncbi:MAG: DUF2061 domain-containing protein [Dehalococcoidales bacterium]